MPHSEGLLQSIGADGAWVLGRWRLRGVEGEPGGVFTLVLERRPEGFRVVMDHTTVEPPAPTTG